MASQIVLEKGKVTIGAGIMRPIRVHFRPRGSVLPPPSNSADCSGLPVMALKVDTRIENTIVRANCR